MTITGAMVKINSGGGGGAAKAASPEAPVAPKLPKDDKSGKVSKAAKAKQKKYDAIALASGSAKAVQPDDIALASVVRGPNVVSNVPLPPEQKTAEIECVRPDGTPAKDFPYQAILADGSEKTGTLDANGKASIAGVPKGSVQVTVGETVAASEVVKLRQEMTQIFQAIITKEKADAKKLADNRSDHNILQDAAEMDLSAKKGIWKGALGLLTWIDDVEDVVNPVNILHRKLVVAWKSYNSDSDDWAATYKKNIEIADHKELVEALGFDPDKVTAEAIAEAYEITSYLFDDEASRELIKQFAKDFALAQDRTEWAEFAGGAMFEIALSAVIVALTGGLGAAAVAAAKSSRLAGKLAELGKVLKKLAAKSKAVKLRKVKSGDTGEVVKVKLDKPSEVEFSSHGQDVDVVPDKVDDVLALKLKAEALEAADGGHSLLRHGPDISDADLRSRALTGISPDNKWSPTHSSTKFDTFDDWVKTREDAITQIQQGNQVNFGENMNVAPAPGAPTSYKIDINHGRAIDSGFNGAGPRAQVVNPYDNSKKRNLHTQVTPVSGITNSYTKIAWNANTSRWNVVQHFPVGKNWNQALQRYNP